MENMVEEGDVVRGEVGVKLGKKGAGRTVSDLQVISKLMSDKSASVVDAKEDGTILGQFLTTWLATI